MIIRRPLITEKSLAQAAKGWYTFAVSEEARKQEIARDIGKFYSVTVTDVKTAIMHGKERRTGRARLLVRKSDWKKAFVKLGKGQTIAAFEVTQETEKK